MKNKLIDYITDYNENIDKIKKWCNLKGEYRYIQYAEFLKSKGIENITWRQLVDTYRYDKRLLFNLFRYISFVEEHFRAILNNYKDDNVDYSIDTFFRKLICEMKQNNIQNKYVKNEDMLCDLRNAVMHTKMILNAEEWCKSKKTIKEHLENLLYSLPEEYKKSFIKTINDMKKDKSTGKLNIDEKIIISL